MTDAWDTTLLDMERFVERHAGFLCERDCLAGDFYGHAERVIKFCAEQIDAQFLGVDPPQDPQTGVAHLDADCHRIYAQWQAKRHGPKR